MNVIKLEIKNVGVNLSDTKFEQELEQLKRIFQKERKDLLKKYKGIYVAYCLNKLAAVGRTYDETAAMAWEKTKHVPIFIEKVMPEGEEETWLMVSI